MVPPDTYSTCALVGGKYTISCEMIANTDTEKYTFIRLMPFWERGKVYKWDGAKCSRCRLVGTRTG
jgi:hypothetical protein